MRLKIKVGKFILKYGFTNKLRIWSLRLMGVKVGKDVYIGEDMVIVSSLSRKLSLVIGDRVSIAPRVNLILSSHPNNSRLKQFYPEKQGSIIIEDDVWIGLGVTIFPNVTIGKLSVLGTGSIIHKNVSEGSIIGSPQSTLIGTNKIDDL